MADDPFGQPIFTETRCLRSRILLSRHSVCLQHTHATVGRGTKYLIRPTIPTLRVPEGERAELSSGNKVVRGMTTTSTVDRPRRRNHHPTLVINTP